MTLIHIGIKGFLRINSSSIMIQKFEVREKTTDKMDKIDCSSRETVKKCNFGNYM